MAISKVRVGEAQEKLMLAIGEAIQRQTMQSPMSLEEIVGVVAFCAGAAIMRGGGSRTDRRQLREMAVANIDYGMDAMRSSVANTSLILPGGLQ